MGSSDVSRASQSDFSSGPNLRSQWVGQRSPLRVTQDVSFGVTLLPKAKEDKPVVGPVEERLLLLLADAFEGQGGMRRARECDEKAETIWFARGQEERLGDFVASSRREALELSAAGRAEEAA